MSREPITIYRMGLISVQVQQGWQLNAHGKLAWLHRLLWRALEKLRALAPVMEDKVEVIRLPVSGDEAVAKIFEAIRSAPLGLEEIYRKPTEILIGPETLAEILNSKEVRDCRVPFSFTGRVGFGRELFELPVHVLPQMEGFLVR